MPPRFPGAFVARPPALRFVMPVRPECSLNLGHLVWCHPGLALSGLSYNTWKPSQMPFYLSSGPFFRVLPLPIWVALWYLWVVLFYILSTYLVVFYVRVGLIRVTLPWPELRPWGAYIKMQCQMSLPDNTDSGGLGWGPKTYAARSAADDSTLRNTFLQHSWVI